MMDTDPGLSSSSFEPNVGSKTKKKHFLLLVSKGSGHLEQRDDQDRAETLMGKYPLELLDGSNHTNSSKQEALFQISHDRKNYPQLFLVDNGHVTYIGGFATILSHDEQGLLNYLLSETRISNGGGKSSTSSSKMIKSGARGMKFFKTVIGRGSKKDSINTGSSQAATTTTSEQLNNQGALEAPAPEAIEELQVKEVKVPMSSSSLGTPVLSKEKILLNPRSDGVIPLHVDVKEKKEKNRSSKSLERNLVTRSLDLDDLDLSARSDKSSSPRSLRTIRTSGRGSGYLADDLDLSTRSDKSSSRRSHRTSRTIIRGNVQRRRWEESLKDNQIDLDAGIDASGSEENDKPSTRIRQRSRSRSASQGVSRRSQARRSLSIEATNESNNNSIDSNSQKVRSRKSVSRPKSKAAEKDGVEDRVSLRRSGVRSSSPHALGSSRREDAGDRKGRSRKSHVRNKNGERSERSSRRSQARSTSPHTMAWRRENRQRPASPGVMRGGGVFARKRGAMKEYREKKNQGSSATETPESPQRPRKNRSSVGMDTKTSPSSVRRSRASTNVGRSERDDSPEPNDESLDELFKRVKEGKRGKPTNPPAELLASQVGTAVAW